MWSGHWHRLPLRAGSRRPLRRRARALLLALCLPLTLAGCGGVPAPSGTKTIASGDTVSLITHGWHTDIGLPATEAQGPLASFRRLFPGAKTLVFGYGKRTFMIAPAHSIGEWMIGPFPGPAAIEVSAIGTDAVTGYGAAHVQTLRLPPGGAARLSEFLWQAFAPGPDGAPRYIAQGNFPGSLFYQARSRYGLRHTCNTWSAEALSAGGLPVHPAGIIFSGALDARARALSGQ